MKKADSPMRTSETGHYKNPYIYKSNAINEAVFTLTAIEYRLLLLLIAQVQHHHEGLRYRFYTKGVAEILNLTNPKTSSTVIRDSVLSLHKHVLHMKDYKTEITHNWLISSIYYREKGYFDLELNPNLKQYFLNLQGEFTRYKLHYVMSLRDLASIRLYELLKQYETLKIRRFSYQQLRQFLGYQSTRYAQAYDFKKWILLPAIKEINEKTDIRIEFDEVKEGRKVIGYHFKIERKEIPPEITTTQTPALLPLHLTLEFEQIGFSASAIQRLASRFSLEQLEDCIQQAKGKHERGEIKELKQYIRRRTQEMWKKQQAQGEGVAFPPISLRSTPSYVPETIDTLPNVPLSKEVEEELLGFGLTIQAIRHLHNQYSEVRIVENLRYIQQKLKRSTIQEPIAYLVSAIRDNYAEKFQAITEEQLPSLPPPTIEGADLEQQIELLHAEYCIERGFIYEQSLKEELQLRYLQKVKEVYPNGLPENLKLIYKFDLI